MPTPNRLDTRPCNAPKRARYPLKPMRERSRSTPPPAKVAATCLACAVLLGTPGCDSEPPVGGPIEVRKTIGSLGDTPGRFVFPRAIDNDAEALWVIDRAGRVQRIDPDSGEATTIWRMPVIDRGKPVGVTVGPDHRTTDPDDVLLYVPDTHYHRVVVYAPPTQDRPEAEIVTQFGTYGTEPGQFIYPTDIALLTDPDSDTPTRIYVSEYGGNDRVSVFDGEYNFMFEFGTFGYAEDSAAAEFNRAQAMEFVEIEGRRELLVADDRNHRIGRFTIDGELIGWIGSPETSPTGDLGSFQYPRGIAGLGDGTVLVAEFGSSRVQHVDVATGEGLGAWGLPGRGEGELATPWGVSILGGRMYVLDSGNNRIVEASCPRRRSR